MPLVSPFNVGCLRYSSQTYPSRISRSVFCFFFHKWSKASERILQLAFGFGLIYVQKRTEAFYSFSFPVGPQKETWHSGSFWRHLSPSSFPLHPPGARWNIQPVGLFSHPEKLCKNMSKQNKKIPWVQKQKKDTTGYEIFCWVSHQTRLIYPPPSPFHFLSSGILGHSALIFSRSLSPSFINIYTANLPTWQLEG